MTRRSSIEILRIIGAYLEKRGGVPVYRSDLRKKGIDPRTAENFFRMIQYCQNQVPRIRISEADERFVVLVE